jgi:hypothetical protein
MANNIPFQPMGKTTFINLPTINTANTVAINADSPCCQVRVHNGTANDVYLAFSQNSTVAVVPVAGTPNYGTVLKGNTISIFTCPQVATGTTTPTLTLSAISSGVGNVYVTPGEGF